MNLIHTPISILVDDYQGDENRIILLSLVRSNENNSVGFVKTVNRIIVSLSRAKEGLYIIGNKNLLITQSKDWLHVVKSLQTSGRCGDKLLLCCPNHPERTTPISQVFHI